MKNDVLYARELHFKVNNIIFQRLFLKNRLPHGEKKISFEIFSIAAIQHK